MYIYIHIYIYICCCLVANLCLTLYESMKVKMKVTQLCLTLYEPMDYTDHGLLQARILQWLDSLFSKGSSQPTDGTQLSHIAGIFFTS